MFLFGGTPSHCHIDAIGVLYQLIQPSQKGPIMRQTGGRLVSALEICETIGISRQTLHAWRQGQVPNLPTFPEPIKLGCRVIRWYEVDVVEWARKAGFDWMRARKQPEKNGL